MSHLAQLELPGGVMKTVYVADRNTVDLELFLCNYTSDIRFIKIRHKRADKRDESLAELIYFDYEIEGTDILCLPYLNVGDSLIIQVDSDGVSVNLYGNPIS